MCIRDSNVTAEIHTTEREAQRRIEGSGPEVKTSPAPTIMVSLPVVGDLQQDLYTTPSPKNKGDSEDSDDTEIGPNSPVMRVTSETIVEVNRRGNDPRLGYGTPYFWRNRPEMRKHYQLQTEFPTLSCAGKFGVNFATKSEEERNRQLHVTGPRPLKRDRFTQTSSVKRQSVAIQFRTPAANVETQIGADTNSVATQIDYQAGSTILDYRQVWMWLQLLRPRDVGEPQRCG